jgi:hypothetical protein
MKPHRIRTRQRIHALILLAAASAVSVIAWSAPQWRRAACPTAGPRPLLSHGPT